MFRDVAGRAGSILGAIPPTSSHGQSAFVFKEPYGVNFAIAPWNAPYVSIVRMFESAFTILTMLEQVLGVRSFLYALAGGNTAILKGSELCPRTFWALGSVMKQAGLPDGVLSVIYHQTSDAAAVANTIIEHPFVKKVNFTGSTITGSIIAAKAGKELKPVLMELGGKASALVCEDADLEKAAMGVAMGSFFHAGQICMATERILVNRKVLEPFAKALKAASEKVYAPDADAPVLVSTAGVDKNLKLLNDATSKGAKVLYGDVKPEQQSSYRLRPVIISDVKKEMDIFYQESFGPTVSLIAVDSDEEAIEIANDTEYGLSGAVFTESLGRGLKIAKEIDSGAIHINSMSVQ